MKIPLLDLKAQHSSLHQKILQALSRVMDSQTFILGPDVKTFEERVAAYSGVKYGIGVSSGTDALLVSLMAFGISSGDEVIVPNYSFFATAGVVARVGATPVFVDIDPVTYNIDPQKIESAITPKTKAIIVVHLFGQCAHMEPILQLAHARGLKVIEDAAQAIGSEYKDGRRAGSMGDVGCFSFFPSKNLGAMGDGGMVVTNDADLAEKVSVLRVHGSKPKYFHKNIGGNFRLDTLQAAVLNVKFDCLDEWTQRRRENVKRYHHFFNDEGFSARTVSLPQAVYEGVGVAHPHIYNQFVLRAHRRNELREYLQKEGIGCEVYYPVPFHRQECFQSLGYAPNDFPASTQASEETLAIPIYPELTDVQLKTVVAKIKDFYL